jgi:glycosyltransferase involved in cell wall biosynthesis
MQGDKEQTAHFIKQYLVNHADIILPNGRSELELINKDFGKPKAAAVIPNGVDALFQNSRADEFTNQYKVEGFVLSVGRIESRKNTLALAKACNALGRRLVLIGNDEHEANYVTAVEQAGGDLLTIIPQMPHQKLGSAYKAAKVHALVSWFETPGLSSLEAAVAGCNIVSTSIGTTKEYFGDMAWYCNPADQTSIEKALKSAFETPRSTKLQQHVLREFSWQHVAQLTAAVYEKIIG